MGRMPEPTDRAVPAQVRLGRESFTVHEAATSAHPRPVLAAVSSTGATSAAIRSSVPLATIATSNTQLGIGIASSESQSSTKWALRSTGAGRSEGLPTARTPSITVAGSCDLLYPCLGGDEDGASGIALQAGSIGMARPSKLGGYGRLAGQMRVPLPCKER
jgi:hypothetical protein